MITLKDDIELTISEDILIKFYNIFKEIKKNIYFNDKYLTTDNLDENYCVFHYYNRDIVTYETFVNEIYKSISDYNNKILSDDICCLMDFEMGKCKMSDVNVEFFYKATDFNLKRDSYELEVINRFISKNFNELCILSDNQNNLNTKFINIINNYKLKLTKDQLVFVHKLGLDFRNIFNSNELYSYYIDECLAYDYDRNSIRIYDILHNVDSSVFINKINAKTKSVNFLYTTKEDFEKTLILLIILYNYQYEYGIEINGIEKFNVDINLLINDKFIKSDRFKIRLYSNINKIFVNKLYDLKYKILNKNIFKYFKNVKFY